MKKLLSVIFLIIIPCTAFGGDYVTKGTTLKEDSYVFSVPEAKDLMNKLSELEQENQTQKLLIDQYKLLDQNNKDQLSNFNSLLETKELQIQDYKKIYELNQDHISYLNKQAKLSRLDNWLFFSAGVGLSIGSILIADKIDDKIQTNNNISQLNSSLLTITF